MPSLPKLFTALLLATALGFFVHRSALDHEFVSWDDDINLYANPNLITGDIRWALPWFEPYQGMWIPVTYTTWGAISALTRREVAHADYELVPAPYHAANLALHLGSTALVLLLLLCWLPTSLDKRRTLAAFLGALVFGLHPIQVEAVHWATALKDTLSAFLAFASLTVLPVTPQRFNWRMPAAWLLFALALCAKPSVVVIPVVWLLFVRARDGRPSMRALLHFGVLIALAIAVAGIARFAQPAGTAPNEYSLFERVWVSIDSLGFYITQVLAPSVFCPDYGRTPEWVLERGLTTASIVGCAYVGLLVLVLITRKWRFACILLVFPAILGPVLGLLPFGHQKFSTVTDRYAYVAMIAPAFLLARLIVMPVLGRIWPLTLGLFGLYIPLSAMAALSWSDTNSMWENVLVVNPRSASAWTNLGFQHEVAGREEQAIEFYERAIQNSPTNALAYNNIGNIHFRANRLDQAKSAYTRARAANPSDLHARNNLGAVNHRRGDLKAAEELFKGVIGINPRFGPAFHNLGLVQVANGELEQAESSYRSALEIDPGFGGALRSLANLLAKLGEDAESRELLSRAIGVEVGEMEFELAWSQLLITTEREPNEIRRARLKAVELGCREPTLLVELGRGLLLAENSEQAEPVLRLAMEHAPGRIEPRLDLAQILKSTERWEEFRELIVATVRDFSFRPEAWQNLAIYHLHNDERGKAEEAVRTALRLNPSFEPSRKLARELEIETK